MEQPGIKAVAIEAGGAHGPVSAQKRTLSVVLQGPKAERGQALGGVRVVNPARAADSSGHLLFVYGTLRQGCRSHDLLDRAAFVGPARTKDRFALYSTGIPYVVRGEPVCPEAMMP